MPRASRAFAGAFANVGLQICYGLWSVSVPKTRKHVSVASYLCSFSCANINGIFPICFTADSFLYLLVFAIEEKKMHWPVSILGLTKTA